MIPSLIVDLDHPQKGPTSISVRPQNSKKLSGPCRESLQGPDDMKVRRLAIF